METEKKGGKSDFGIYAKKKNGLTGATERKYVLNGYKSQYGYNVTLAPGWKLVHDDGTTVTTGRDGSYYLNTSGLAVTSAYQAPREPGEDLPF